MAEHRLGIVVEVISWRPDIAELIIDFFVGSHEEGNVESKVANR